MLSITLIAQVLIIMASALRRLHLYEQAYGFTTLRLFSHAFAIFLGVVFLILAYKIVRSASDKAFAFPAFLAAIAFLAALNLLNPDAFIARQNLQRFDETGKVDTYYLSGLSDDAVPVIVRHLESLPADEQKVLRVSLSDRKGEGTDRPTDWQSWNLSRQRADRALANEFEP
jgi:two-component system, OmpR family, sensor histidine kinase BaeS